MIHLVTDDTHDPRPEPPPWEGENVVDMERARAERAALRGVRYGELFYLTDVDALGSLERGYFLKGILSPNEMSVVYGPPSCGKTFLVLYKARAIAQARSIFGRRVHGTKVLYMALEGVSGFEKRLKAEILKHGEAESFGYVAQPVNLFSSTKARDSVIEIIQSTGTGLVIIDTLNRAIAEGSENDAADMGQFIQNIDAIRAATAAHVMIVHHSGKDVERGMRGHSALLGAADVAIEVARDPDSKQRTATIRKCKDDADGHKLGFYLDVVEMGADEDGDAITTCTVREAEGESAPVGPRLTPSERQWMDCLIQYFAREGTTQLVKPERSMSVALPCATRDQIRGWARTRGLIGVAENVASDQPLKSTDRNRLSRALNDLRAKNKIGIHGDWIWLI